MVFFIDVTYPKMLRLFRSIFYFWGLKLGKRANYRKKDGTRLSAVEYRKRRQREIYFHISLVVLIPVLLITTIFLAVNKVKTNKDNESVQEIEIVDNSSEELSIIDTVIADVEVEEENPYLERSVDSDSFFEGYNIDLDSDTVGITSEGVYSTYGLLINLDTGKVVASKEGNVRINPASMTKILTLLVAVEHLDDIDNTFTMTQAIGDYVFKHDCSQVGFEVGEVVTIKDLLY